MWERCCKGAAGKSDKEVESGSMLAATAGAEGGSLTDGEMLRAILKHARSMDAKVGRMEAKGEQQF